MSYILEGLKKLEKNRQRVGTQVLFTTYNSTPPGRDKKKWRRYLPVLALVAILMIGAGAYWWLASTRSGKSAGISQPRPVVMAEPESQPPQQAEPQRVAASDPKPLDPPLIEKLEDTPPPVQDKPARKSSRRKDMPAVEATADDAVLSEGAGSAKSGEKIISFNQLPEGVKKSLPEIKVFLHYFSSEPKERFVQINDSTLHEGQSRPDGLRVMRITEHGAIFSYQGHRFQIRAIEK